MAGHQHPLFPGRIAVRNRLPQGAGFELHAQRIEVLELRERQVSHPKTAVAFGLHHLLTRQALERFASRADAHAIPILQYVKCQLGAGGEPPETMSALIRR